jgi:hypothetical protein
MQTTFTVTKIDTPDEKPIGERIRFKIEFMLLMLQVGRTDEAQSVYDQITDLLEEIDNA